MIGDPSGLPAGERVSELVEENNGKKRQIIKSRPNGALVCTHPLGKRIPRNDKPSKMQIDLDAAEFEEPNSALHKDFEATAKTMRVRAVLQSYAGRSVCRNEQSHRQHGGFVEAVALEEILRAQLRTVRQQGDTQELF